MFFLIYPDKANEFRWRLKSMNGAILADSGEGYSTKENCERAIKKIKQEIAEAVIIEGVEL